MAKHIIINYEKIRTSFLSRINSICDSTGQVKEPYDIFLEKRSFFGLRKKRLTKRVYLPQGFNHEKELQTGREFFFKK